MFKQLISYNKWLVLTALVVLTTNLSFGQKFVGKSSVEGNTPELNETIEVTYKLISKSNSVNLYNPKFSLSRSNFKGFQLVDQYQARMGMEITSEGITIFNYKVFLKCIELGDQTIPGLTIGFKGQSYKTSPIQIKVKKGVVDNSIKEAMELRIQTNSNNCLIGESIKCDIVLYSAYHVLEGSFTPNPTFDGFIAEEIKETEKQKTKKINGVKYNLYHLKSYLLTPTKSGKLPINGITLNSVVNTGRGIAQKKSISQYKSINVKQLPNGAPLGFNGLVGEFSLTQKTDKKELAVNDAVTLRIKIKGTGNLSSMEDIKLKLPSSFESLPPNVISKISPTPFGFNGSKGYEFVAIPRQPGRFTIPSAEIVYFNTKTKQYETLKTKPFHIKVTGKADTQLAGSYDSNNKSTVELQASDIRYLKPSTELSSEHETIYFTGSKVHYIILFISILCFTIGGYFFKEKQYSSSELKAAKRDKANKTASKYLKHAQEAISGNDGDFYQAIDKALSEYLLGKLMIEKSQLNKTSITSLLSGKQVPEELIKKVNTVSDQCKMARYSPLNISKETMLHEAEAIINELEKTIK